MENTGNFQAPQPPYQAPQQPFQTQKALPNATAVLVLGIISIPTFCFCLGLVGMILGIIALSLAGKPKKMYLENPSLYTESSYKNLNAGKICAIIGLSLSSLILIIYLIYFLVVGAAISTAFSSMPWDSFNY